MQLAEILECLNSENISTKLKIINVATYVKEIKKEIKFDRENCLFLYLGQKFKTFNKSEFELYYDFISKAIIKQMVTVTNRQKILGQICGFVDKKEFITGVSEICINGISTNQNSYIHYYIENYNTVEYSNEIIHSIKCKNNLEDNNESFLIDSFKVFDNEDENKILKRFPLNFDVLEIFYNTKLNTYQKLSDYTNHSNQDADDERENIDYRIQESIKNGEDEV